MSSPDARNNLTVVFRKEIALHVSQFLDPQSFHRWCLVWMTEEEEDDDDGDVGNALSSQTSATLDRLHRLGEALPPYVAYSNPIEMIAPDRDVTMNSTIDGDDNIWEQKKRIFNHLFLRRSYDCITMERSVQAWLGNNQVVPTGNVSFLKDFVSLFVDYTVTRNEDVHRNVFFRDDFALCADLWNIKCSFPLEKTFELPLFSGQTMVGTLRDIAALDTERKPNYLLNRGPHFSMENLSHDEQVNRARGNLERYLQNTDEDWSEWYAQLVHIYEQDPLITLGEENNSDADWDEWFCMDHEDNISKSDIDRGFEIFDKEVREGLQSFVNTLSSLTPEAQSITNPNFRLSRSAFRDIIQRALSHHRADMSVAHSAIDFLHRIVEDLCFGTVMRPFKLHAPSLGVCVCCIVLMGDVHGTIMSRLEVCSQDDDDDENDGEDGDSDDSDVDYDPYLSDMEESDDDDKP